jgi:hypothetical protein
MEEMPTNEAYIALISRTRRIEIENKIRSGLEEEQEYELCPCVVRIE